MEVRSPELRQGDQAEVSIVVTHPTGDQRETAKTGGWRRYAGAVDSRNPRAGDNQRIDADLAAEYGKPSSEEP